jgi:hypothetical protein
LYYYTLISSQAATDSRGARTHASRVDTHVDARLGLGRLSGAQGLLLAPPLSLHGYAISIRIKEASSEVLQVEEGSLYPALNRMLVKGWLTAKWGISEQSESPLLSTHSGRSRCTAAGREGFPASGKRHFAGDAYSLRKNYEDVGRIQAATPLLNAAEEL